MTIWRSKDAGKVGSDRHRPFLDTMTSDSIHQQDRTRIPHPVDHWLQKWNIGPLVVFKGVLSKWMVKMSFYSAHTVVQLFIYLVV